MKFKDFSTVREIKIENFAYFDETRIKPETWCDVEIENWISYGK